MKFFLTLFFVLFAFQANAAELIEIKVEGLKNDKTEEVVRNTLQALPDVDIAEADKDTSRVAVSVKEGKYLPSALLTSALEKMGLKVVSVSRTGE